MTIGEILNEEYKVYITVLIIGLFFCTRFFPPEKLPTFEFYSLALISSMLCIYISGQIENNFFSFLFFSLGIFCIGFPMAFRLPVAIDDESYMIVFYGAKDKSLSDFFSFSEQEKGYLILNWIMFRLLEGNYSHFVVFITYLTFIFWGIGFRMAGGKSGSTMFLVLFVWSHLYFFVLNAALIRIFLAVSITFIGIQYIWQDKWKRFVLMILLASSIHMSALIMFIFLLFYLKKKWFYKHWFIFVLITFLVTSISLLFAARYLVPILGDKYEAYAETDSISLSSGSFTTLPIWIACYYYYKQLPSVTSIYRKQYIICMILLSLTIIFSISASMVHVGRIIYYAYLGIIILIPSMFQIRTRNISDIILKCLFIIYPLVYIMLTTMLNENQTQLFPYQSFLTEDILTLLL